MNYKIKDLPILEGIVSRRPISETYVVHPCVQRFLQAEGYVVHHEKLAFRVPFDSQRMSLRVDFLAFRGDEILIVECKGSQFSAKQSLRTLLQVSLYMRVYKMARNFPNPQLSLFEDFDEKLARDGNIKGILAIPYFSAANDLYEAAQHLKSVNLVESSIEVWRLVTP